MSVSHRYLSLRAERRLRRTARLAGRMVLMLAAVAQLFGVLAGPLEHWRTDSRVGPHIEASGSSQNHYAHDEATCVACAIGHMTASPARRLTEFLRSRANTSALRGVAQISPYHAPHTQAAPRAPPTQNRIG